MIWYLIHKETSKEKHKDNINLTLNSMSYYNNDPYGNQ